jgi:hypothetical protein
MNIIRDAKELGKALKDKKDTIEIEGDWVKKVVRIKATGKIAWAICLASIGIAVTMVIKQLCSPAQVLTAVGSSPVKGLIAAGTVLTAAAPSVAVMGFGATMTATTIALGAGGVGALNSLRGYKLIKHSDTYATLIRK